MPTRKKKSFFRERTVAEIRKLDLQEAALDDDLVSRIFALDRDEGLVITDPFIPDGFTPRKFLKHGDEVSVPSPRIYTAIGLKALGESPVHWREKAFNQINDDDYRAYSFVPVRGNDRRRRVVSLVECIEGARLYAYSQRDLEDYISEQGTVRPGKVAPIRMEPYIDAERVAIEGGKIVFWVPSRTQGQGRYKLTLGSIPIIDNDEKFVISTGISSDHACEAKR